MFVDLKVRIFVFLFVILSLSVSQSAASEKQSDDENSKFEKCKSKLTRAGRPNPIKQVASLNAVGAWIKAAGEIGDEYADWGKASGAAVSCAKKGPRVYLCYASAKPCYAKPVSLRDANQGETPVGALR